MNRRQLIVAWGVVGALTAAVLVLGYLQFRAKRDRATPAWTDAGQPPDGIASELPILGADQSWAANRCRPMTACCTGNTAGVRQRRDYAPTLEESPNSFIRTRFDLEAKAGC